MRRSAREACTFAVQEFVTEVVNVAYEKTVGCEFKAYLEAINEADTVIAVYDPDDPRCEREAAAGIVAELLNKQILTLDPKAIRL